MMQARAEAKEGREIFPGGMGWGGWGVCMLCGGRMDRMERGVAAGRYLVLW